MTSAAKAFADQRRELLFRQPPSPPKLVPAEILPWQIAKGGELPPVMFQLRYQDGSITSYAYSDLREIRYRDAGHIELGISGLTRMLITIEGRHLRELAEYLGSGMVYWVQEADERDVDIPESKPCITSITVTRLDKE